MVFKTFSELLGEYVEEIKGQSRFSYALIGNVDLFEIPEIIEHNSRYIGSILKFYDFETGFRVIIRRAANSDNGYLVSSHLFEE